MTETLKLWEYLAGLATFLIGVGVFYEHVRSKFREYDKAMGACHVGELMTEEKCAKIHNERNQVINLQITQLREIIHELREERKDAEIERKQEAMRWGSLASKIDIIIDRMDRGGGSYGKATS